MVTGERFEFGDLARVECQPGFRTVGADSLKCLANQTLSDVPECQDIDECAEGSAICSIQSTKCINMPGGYHCQCLSGFQAQLCKIYITVSIIYITIGMTYTTVSIIYITIAMIITFHIMQNLFS